MTAPECRRKRAPGSARNTQPRGSPGRGIDHRSRSGDGRAVDTDRRPPRTTRSARGEGSPAAPAVRSRADAATNLAPATAMSDTLDPTSKSALDGEARWQDRAFRLLWVRAPLRGRALHEPPAGRRLPGYSVRDATVRNPRILAAVYTRSTGSPSAARTRYALHEPRSRRGFRRDASSRAWTFGQRAAGCCSGGTGGGTVTGPTSISSSRSESRARVVRQYLGASSR